MAGFVPGGPNHRNQPQMGDADALDRYSSRLRAAASKLQSISDDADAWVCFYKDGWQGDWADALFAMWCEQITANDAMNASAWAQDRANFVRAHPRYARLYDLSSDHGQTCFRYAIDSCNSMADWLHGCAMQIRQEEAQQEAFFLDALIVIAAVGISALSLGSLSAPAMILAGAVVGGITAGAIDATNQGVYNQYGLQNGFDWEELGLSTFTGSVVGGLSALAGLGLGFVLVRGLGYIATDALPALSRSLIGFDSLDGVGESVGGFSKSLTGFSRFMSNSLDTPNGLLQLNTARGLLQLGTRISLHSVGFGAGTFASEVGMQAFDHWVDPSSRAFKGVDLGQAAQDALVSAGLGAAFEAGHTALHPNVMSWSIDTPNGHYDMYGEADGTNYVFGGPGGGGGKGPFLGTGEIKPAALVEDGTAIQVRSLQITRADNTVEIVPLVNSDFTAATPTMKVDITFDQTGSMRLGRIEWISDGAVTFNTTDGAVTPEGGLRVGVDANGTLKTWEPAWPKKFSEYGLVNGGSTSDGGGLTSQIEMGRQPATLRETPLLAAGGMADTAEAGTWVVEGSVGRNPDPTPTGMSIDSSPVQATVRTTAQEPSADTTAHMGPDGSQDSPNAVSAQPAWTPVTSSPEVASGDGVMAAGDLQDGPGVPSSLRVGPASGGQPPLVAQAVRALSDGLQELSAAADAVIGAGRKGVSGAELDGLRRAASDAMTRMHERLRQAQELAGSEQSARDRLSEAAGRAATLSGWTKPEQGEALTRLESMPLGLALASTREAVEATRALLNVLNIDPIPVGALPGPGGLRAGVRGIGHGLGIRLPTPHHYDGGHPQDHVPPPNAPVEPLRGTPPAPSPQAPPTDTPPAVAGTAHHGQQLSAPIEAGSFAEFRPQLYEHLRDQADRRGTAVRDELQQFALQRVLARFFTLHPDNWVLKGGQSMLARFPGARASTDLDFTRTAPADPDSMAADYERALQLDLGDHLTFVLESRTSLDSVGGVRLKHVVYLGGQQLMPISVDLAPPRAIPVWREADVIPFPERAIRTGAPGERPDVRVISLSDTLAHKVSGMFSYGTRTVENGCADCKPLGGGRFLCKEGELPARAQDLADVLLIALNSSWDGPTTYAMLRAEFEWRITQHGEDLRIPGHFEVPNPIWSRSFARHAATMPGLPFLSLGEAEPLARAFLDPLLGPAPPQGTWDPQQRLWTDGAAAQAGEPGLPPQRLAELGLSTGSSSVRWLEATGHAPASNALAEVEMIARWDELAAGGEAPGSLDALLAEIKQADRPLQAKIGHLRTQIMARAGYETSPVTSLDSKNLRFYVHQRGELYIHAAALMADPETTLEIAYQADKAFNTYRWEAHQAYIAHMGPLPEGMRADQANAIAYWRALSGKPIRGIDAAELMDDLIELHAQPLREALKLRQRLIDDYGIAPSRIRLAHAPDQDPNYPGTRWERAHLLALGALRTNPGGARQAMLAAMRGPEGEAGAREVRARAVAERLFAANERSGPGPGGQGAAAPERYALLWIRDSRNQPVGARHGPHLDTRPEMVRQTIEALRESHPQWQVVLVGDDLFARRPELRQAWEADGVLDGVDTESLVTFWASTRNGGQPLSHAEQALFFHHLSTVRAVVQIGMESGALEMPMVLGLPTVYLEALEHDGNKGNRWGLYWKEWAFGQTEPLRDVTGRLHFDDSAHAITTFQVTEQLPPPLSTIDRVLFGPDLRDPANRRLQATAVYLPAKVAVTSDRIIRLVDSGELQRWAERLGRSVKLEGRRWEDWNEQDWAQSAFYARQLSRWLSTAVDTPEAAGQKWDSVRLALTGVIEPRFDKDETYEGAALVHPYYLLRTDQPTAADMETLITEAYASEPGRRAAAVARVLRQLLGGPELRWQALNDLRLFALSPSEIQALRAAIDRVTGSAAH